jgi:hypothetical protein
MKTIYKYELKITDIQSIEMPIGAEILSAGLQKQTPCIWALVEDENKLQNRIIEVLGTGNPIIQEGSRKFIGTFILANGFVGHVFEY